MLLEDCAQKLKPRRREHLGDCLQARKNDHAGFLDRSDFTTKGFRPLDLSVLDRLNNDTDLLELQLSNGPA